MVRLDLRLDRRIVGFLVGVAVLSSGCSPIAAPAPATAAAGPQVSLPEPADAGPAIPVLGAENFYADLLAEVGGARVAATSLLNDPNTDPHTFEASAQAAAAVADARLVIVNGLGYDDFMQRLLGATGNRGREVIDVQQLLGAATDSNAHVWYDPATMTKLAAAVEAALTKLEPANAAYFAAAEQGYLASLGPLSAKVAELHAKYAGAAVAFTEPVAAYLATAIGLQVLSPDGLQKAIEGGTDPPPADVAAEYDLLTGHKVRLLLYNSQTVTPLTQQIRDLAVANGVPVVGVAETLPPQYRTYVEWQLAQLNAIEQALAKGG